MAGKTRDIHLTAGAGGRAVIILPPQAPLWPVTHQTLGGGGRGGQGAGRRSVLRPGPDRGQASGRRAERGRAHSRNDDAQRVDAPGVVLVSSSGMPWVEVQEQCRISPV